MLWRLNRLEPVGKFRSERVGDFGDHRSSFTAIEHVLDEGPLDRIPRSATSWLDSVASVAQVSARTRLIELAVGELGRLRP